MIRKGGILKWRNMENQRKLEEEEAQKLQILEKRMQEKESEYENLKRIPSEQFRAVSNLKKIRAAIKIQKIWRGKQVRTELTQKGGIKKLIETEKIKNQSANIIQRAWRKKKSEKFVIRNIPIEPTLDYKKKNFYSIQIQQKIHSELQKENIQTPDEEELGRLVSENVFLFSLIRIFAGSDSGSKICCVYTNLPETKCLLFLDK
jgi:hypothetical protein